jgi:heat shock protein 5
MRGLTDDPENTIFLIERLLGRHFSDPTFQKDLQHLPFKILNKNDRPCIEIHFQGRPQQFYPEEIVSMILTEVKTFAESYVGRFINEAVIAVPAHFRDDAYQSMIDAAGISGLRVRTILLAPIAACWATFSGNRSKVLVFELGRETLDVSVINIDSGQFVVLGTGHGGDFGEKDFIERLLVYVNSIYESTTNTNSRFCRSSEIEKSGNSSD